MWQSLIVGMLIVITSATAFAQQNDPKAPNDSTSNAATIPVEIEKASKEIFGIDPKNKFSLYQPSYFILGKDNLKLQFSGKYRVAQTYNLYLAYTQTMFWSVFETSAPFDDINYNPEIFYRFFDKEENFIRSMDLGIIHTSNGEDKPKSRSINRVFAKTNFITSAGRHSILGDFKLQHIYSKSVDNDTIVDYMGYWELKLTLTHVLVYGSSRLDVEYRFFAGKKIINVDKGGRELGLVYRLGSDNFNPAFYVQYYSGYAESLLHYNQKVSQFRGGLLLFF